MPHKLAHLVPIATLITIAAIASALPAQAGSTPRAAYTRAVTQICEHAILFEGSHAIGTRAGALEVADDIRATTRRRLARIAALPTPRSEEQSVARWRALEQRLAETYALTFVRIYDLIAERRITPGQRLRAARRLARLMRTPDHLRGAAAHLEQQLRVPDCTGGSGGDSWKSGGILGSS